MELSPSSPVIQAIPITECQEALVDLKQQTSIAVGPVPECPETEPHYSWVRESVYQRLQEAQRLLPAGLQLRLYEGYRSPAVQAMLFEAELQRVRQRCPTAAEQECWNLAAKLVSAPQKLDGTANTPPHSTGAAVDLDIIDARGCPLDFGMPIGGWAEVDPVLCLADAPELSSRARQNRQLLNAVMTDAGFIDYPTEWWHFSWGDQYWAWRNGQTSALFGPLDPPC